MIDEGMFFLFDYKVEKFTLYLRVPLRIVDASLMPYSSL